MELIQVGSSKRDVEPGAWLQGGSKQERVDVQVSIRNVNYIETVSESLRDVPNVAKALASMLRKTPNVDLNILSNVSLDFAPGTMTLILGGPGSGKSSLLKLVAGALPASKVTGSVLHNGGAPTQSTAALVKYVEQGERHMPLLTVRETLQFAETFQNSTGNGGPCKVDAVMRELRLTNAADTLVGNELLRGISGGEKRRLTLAEMLMGTPRVLCLDEITTGLDSSTSLSILTSLRDWAVHTGGTVVASLLQPIPEVFALFDSLILLQDGYPVYSGPRDGALPFLEKHTSAACPEDRDFADFIVEYLTDPQGTLFRQYAARASVAQLPPVKTPQELSLLNMAQAHNQALATPAAAPSYKVPSMHYAKSLLQQILMCTKIIARLHFRNKENFLGPFLMQSIVQGLVVGSLWYQLAPSAFVSKVSLLFFLIVQVTFFNMVEIGVASEFKEVAVKHVDNGFFHPYAWVSASAIAHLPFAFANLWMFFTISYWMAGLSSAPSDYFRFLVIAFSADLVMSAAFRTSVFVSPDRIVASIIAPVIGIAGLIFSGYVITYDNVPNWLIWLFYLSPFSWTIRSWALIELQSSVYTRAESAVGLALFQFQTDNIWIGLGILYNLMLYLLLFILGAVALKYLRFRKVAGTARTSALSTEGMVTVAVTSNPIRFTPASISWKNITYSVMTGKPPAEKTLLHDITGVCAPGNLIALMGASGAGKTTLLDVLAKRKRTGKVKGSILINGEEVSPTQFKSMVAYVQQQDCHIGSATVREALEFSAKLRLPSDVTPEQRTALVDTTLELLQLSHLANSLVGDADYSGLSPSQAKRLTIGLELVTNPSILLVDEPTTGLDSKSAMTVLLALRSIASTGRSIVCTIHQPSAELFFMFDSLLLLQPGGKQVYCGPVGHRGAAIKEYFENAPGVAPMPQRMNPATWVVELISQSMQQQQLQQQAGGEATARTGKTSGSSQSEEVRNDFAALYASSAAAQATMQSANSVKAVFQASTSTKPGLWSQVYILVRRSALMQWRDTKYNMSRIITVGGMFLFFGLVFRNLHRHDFGTVQSTMGVLCLMSGFMNALFMQGAIARTLRDRAPFYRETASGTYHSLVFPLANYFIELPITVPLSLLGIVASYFLIGFSLEAPRFFLMWFTTYMLGLAGISIGMMFAYLLPNQAVIAIFMGLSQNMFWLFNGVVTQYSHIPKGWRWFYYITPYNHASYGMAVSQMGNSDRIITLIGGGTSTESDLIGSVWGFNYHYGWIQSLIIFAFIVVFMTVALFASRKIRHLS